MEIKLNEATRNRPAGDRIIDAPFVLTNLQTVIDKLKAEDAWADNSRNAMTVFKSDGFTSVVIGLHKGESLNDNEVEALAFFQVLEGNVQLTMGEENVKTDAGKGELLAVHRELSYTVKATEDSFLLMTITGE